MLNTVPLKPVFNKDADNKYKLVHESIIDEGIRKIESKDNDHFNNFDTAFDNYNHNSHNGHNIHITKAFHSKNVFANLSKSRLDDNTFSKPLNKRDNINKNDITCNTPNINPIINDDKKFMISFNAKTLKFSVLDDSNNPLGNFTVYDILKYLGNVYDTKHQFLNELDDKEFEKSKELIKSLIVKLHYNKTTNYTNIQLHDYSTSGFMGNVELLIKLNTQLLKIENDELQSLLAKVDTDNRILMETNIKKFIYLLLNYTLQLISIASDKLENKNDAINVQLLKYSIDISNRINLFVQDQLKTIDSQHKSLSDNIQKSQQIKEELINILKAKNLT